MQGSTLKAYHQTQIMPHTLAGADDARQCWANLWWPCMHHSWHSHMEDVRWWREGSEHLRASAEVRRCF